jgi:hypothetical protein
MVVPEHRNLDKKYLHCRFIFFFFHFLFDIWLNFYNLFWFIFATIKWGTQKNLSKVECYYCNEMGHTKHNCPRLKRKSDKHRRGKVAGVITSETNLSTETNVVSGKTREMFRQAISNVGCSTLANNTIAASVLSNFPRYWFSWLDCRLGSVQPHDIWWNRFSLFKSCSLHPLHSNILFYR